MSFTLITHDAFICKGIYHCPSLVCRGIYQTVPVYGASPSTKRSFQEGRHFIEYKAVDEGGNFDSCSFYVNVDGE